jgi:hypothetical protein
VAGGVGTSALYIGSILKKHDFTAVAENLVIELDGESRDYKLEQNIRNAADLAEFLMTRFKLLGIKAIATGCPADCGSYCKYCSDHGKQRVFPSSWSQSLMINPSDNTSQPIPGSFAGKGLYKFQYLGNATGGQKPSRELALFVFHCTDPTDPKCDLKTNISSSPHSVMITEAIPDPSPITSGMRGQLGGIAGTDLDFVLQVNLIPTIRQ